VTSASREAAAQRFLLDQGLQAAGEQASWIPLVGGVSSDLWRVDLPGRTLCVKAALPTLRVADEWHAPVERNAVEYAWLLFAGRQRPGCVPGLLGHDPGAGFFAMEFLPPATAPSWKAELMAGRVDPVLAGQVGDVIGQIHAVSATDPQVPEPSPRTATSPRCGLSRTSTSRPAAIPVWRTAWVSSPNALRRPGSPSSTVTSARRTSWPDAMAR